MYKYSYIAMYTYNYILWMYTVFMFPAERNIYIGGTFCELVMRNYSKMLHLHVIEDQVCVVEKSKVSM